MSQSARLVRIEVDGIPRYAASLPVDVAPSLDPATHYTGSREATLTYVLMLDAINFGSGYFPRLRKRPGMSGYFTVASSLKDYFDAHGPLQLPGVTAADCTRIFGQEPGDAAVDELMGLFAHALNDLGELARGRYSALVERAAGSAERLVGVLTEMPFYRDVSQYDGREVPFYKRAQLTAADLSVAGVASFEDLDRLTIFADNLVPHVLRVDGILRYEPGLARRIDAEELIQAGSPEEVELRAAAVHAVELIVKALDHRVTAMGMDYVLWNRGQQPKYKTIPRHRTRSVFY